MSNKHYTARGEQIDMHALSMKHAKTPALGNAKMNARGDILGDNGIVLKTQEQIEEEWRKNNERKAASVGISPDIKQPLPLDALPTKKQMLEDQNFDPGTATKADELKTLVNNSASNSRRRKITDSET